MVSSPIAYAPAGYAPAIGNPVPIPGPSVIPSTQLPNPMPVKPGPNQ